MKRILLLVPTVLSAVALARTGYARFRQAQAIWNDPKVAKARSKTVKIARATAAKHRAKTA